MLKEKAAQFNADPEIQAILEEINADDPALAALFGKYSSEKAEGIKALNLDRKVISERGLKYERLDQLTIDLLLGMRS